MHSFNPVASWFIYKAKDLSAPLAQYICLWSLKGRTDERESHSISERYYILGRGDHHFLQGSQASPVSPSDKGSVKIKTSELSEAVASDRGRGIFISELIVKCIICKDNYVTFIAEGFNCNEFQCTAAWEARGNKLQHLTETARIVCSISAIVSTTAARHKNWAQHK
jgi:hypothetical protein